LHLTQIIATHTYQKMIIDMKPKSLYPTDCGFLATVQSR
jgi:hypothetical protein